MKSINLTPQQIEIADFPTKGRLFLSGQAGCGKTTAAVQRMLNLINKGVPAESILILLPQRSLARPYKEAISTVDFRTGGEPALITIGGLAQRMVALFWPIVSTEAGFFNPKQPPRFLTLETAQYYLSQLVDPLLQKGYFESVTIDPNRLYSQILDNLNKSAVVGFPPDQIASRLTQAWAGKPSQTIIFEQAQECALLFRNFCLKENLLDFSLQLAVFKNYLWQSFLCKSFLKANYRHLFYDNCEEDYGVAHDIVLDWLPDFESALILNDLDAGFRTFMGADPVSALRLMSACEHSQNWNDSLVKTDNMDQLQTSLSTSINEHHLDQPIDLSVQKAFSIHSFRFYPQLMDWIIAEINDLVTTRHYSPTEIVILTPFLSDSLRFSLQTRFSECGLHLHTFRPSRGLRDEPAVKAVLTLLKLAFPAWGFRITKDEVRSTMMLILEDCDYIRADLIAQILFTQSTGVLRSFDPINKEMQQRLTFSLGERFEHLRTWLEQNNQNPGCDLDIFVSRLFGEILSQPGFKFHLDYDSAAAVSRLVESSRKFRQIFDEITINKDESINTEYIHQVENGILSAQYLSEWNLARPAESVLVSPAFSYLMSNQPSRIQFWLDIGSQGWWTRLDQPLTHPYVLNRNWQNGQLWTDMHEHKVNQLSLSRVTNGLLRRCREHVYMCTLGINEQGQEERGALIMAVQTILRKLNAVSGELHV